jgi:monoamine oxidase
MSWTRREFLVGTAAAAVGAGVATGPAHAAPEEGVRYDVIVVGGGLAGLTAARELRRSGRRVLVVEARERLGGRTFTGELAGQSIEYGGTWVHWAQPHVWAEITRYGLEVVEVPASQPPPSTAVLSAGGRRIASPADFEALMGGIAQFCAPSVEAYPRPYEPFFSGAVQGFDARSVRDRLRELALPPATSEMLDAYWSTLCHGALEEASFAEMLRLYALSGHSPIVLSQAAAGYKFAAGTGALVDALLRDGAPEVALGAIASAIVQSPGGVVVETARGRFAAACAIVTLPLNTLGGVRFDPPLSDARRAASRERHAGRGIKLYAHVRGDLGNVSGFAPGGNPISWFATQHHGEAGTLLVAFGAKGGVLEVSDRAAVQEALRRFLPDVEVTSVASWDWNADPYALGTWCTLRPRQATRYLRELERAEGRLVFASADWARGWRGFMDGAIEQGLDGARRALSLLASG